MRARYVADRDGNLTVVPLPDPNFEDVEYAVATASTGPRKPRKAPKPEPPVDDPRYDSDGHEIGKYLYL